MKLYGVIIAAMLLIPFTGRTQAHIGSTEKEIREMHPDKTWETGTTKTGEKYIYTQFDYGTFFYYFNDSTGVSDLCLQVPKDMTSMNAQVQIYNGKYVIDSKTTWTAYLEGGGMLFIELKYIEDEKAYIFSYIDGH